MSCETCYKANHQACSDNIFIPAGLINLANTTLIVELTDKFGHVYIQECDVDGAGNLFFELGDFPEGYLNENFGPVTIRLKQYITSECYMDFIKTDCGNEDQTYNCFKITPVKQVLTSVSLLDQEDNQGHIQQEDGNNIIIDT